MRFTVLVLIGLLQSARALGCQSLVNEMVSIPAGSYKPAMFGEKPDESIQVSAFRINRFPVTECEFLKFVRKNSQWRRSNIKRVFADPHYLENWSADLKVKQGSAPVTRVSWFAASAYCEWRGMQLPTTDQWEYTLEDQKRNSTRVREGILEWYGQPNRDSLPNVKTASRNGFGVAGLYGLVWEWTQDFNNFMISEESRAAGSVDNNLFCGSGSLKAKDSEDYPAFMRFSFRNSLKANYTTANLGFRCVQEGTK